ncbi:hypothetical protein G3580_00300 [Nitrogeniibacter mangrovi]|uniref:Pilus assembly protein n=1 Tax=Nitrogeniibacter mangrovi TaxID=2016596 RepID=A0A6C1AZN9_9RHOO|nr:hypothetical protein [Nitrogeniibacter mangrovi]QID16199.1 hypothetical protein G3580_00300 [Nitrogeniibacter mangrovi]
MSAPARLDLDLIPQRRPPGALGWALLVLGLLMSGIEVSHYVDRRADLAEREQIVARLRHQVERARHADRREAASDTPVSAEEAAPALKLAHQLERDWPRLFAAVAEAGGPGVSLMALTPDALRGVVRLNAEADGLQALFDYMGRLEQRPELRNVQLLAYEEAGGRFRFNLAADWVGAP